VALVVELLFVAKLVQAQKADPRYVQNKKTGHLTRCSRSQDHARLLQAFILSPEDNGRDQFDERGTLGPRWWKCYNQSPSELWAAHCLETRLWKVELSKLIHSRKGRAANDEFRLQRSAVKRHFERVLY